ncbi:MAG TPA: hypothetical protein VIJ25_00280, partial [Methylococcales bacterium]
MAIKTMAFIVGSTLVFLLAGCGLMGKGVDRQRVQVIDGDVHITEPITWSEAHYKIKGSLIIEKGGVLQVKNCNVELLNEYARQYRIELNGGELITENTTIGGTKRQGIIQQTYFKLEAGLWRCTDTTVRYCYGITFGNSGVPAKLRALRLMPGENPDSIIMSGKGDVVVVDSNFSISLHVNTQNGGNSVLDLPSGEAITKIFDGQNVPGAEYRLELVNTKVQFWFLFFVIDPSGKPAQITLRRCPNIIPSIMSHNLTGSFQLPTSWQGNNPDSWTKHLPYHTTVQIGNLTLKTLDEPVHIPAWGVYLTGEKTDVTLLGPTVICELMLWAGKATMLGDPNTYNVWTTATTIDVGNPEGMPAAESIKGDNTSAPTA